jgi:alpha-D-ribose 1-methylphosphonate 5-triphosphate synthase subunit PhnI
VESDIRQTDEKIRMTEKQINATVSEVASMANVVNKQLAGLGLQQAESESGYT